MRKLFLFIFLVFVTLNVEAQFDSNTGSISVPKGEATTPNTPSVSTASPFTDNQPNLPSYIKPYQVGANNNDDSFSMYEKDEFVNRSGEYMDRVKIKRRGESNEAYKGNQFFGEHRSNAVFVRVMARDFEYEDGDRIKVMVNDRVVVPEIVLTNNFRGVQITLEPGFNKIDFVALNQGTSGPNTAEFRVHDDKDQLVSSNQWNLATGFKATVIIVKE